MSKAVIFTTSKEDVTINVNFFSNVKDYQFINHLKRQVDNEFKASQKDKDKKHELFKLINYCEFKVLEEDNILFEPVTDKSTGPTVITDNSLISASTTGITANLIESNELSSQTSIQITVNEIEKCNTYLRQLHNRYNYWLDNYETELQLKFADFDKQK